MVENKETDYFIICDKSFKKLVIFYFPFCEFVLLPTWLLCPYSSVGRAPDL